MLSFYQIPIQEIEVTAPISTISGELIRTSTNEHSEFFRRGKNIAIIPALNPDSQTYGFLFIYSLPGIDSWSPPHNMYCTYGLNPTQTKQAEQFYPSRFDNLATMKLNNTPTPNILLTKEYNIEELITRIECQQEIKIMLEPALVIFNQHVTLNHKLADILDKTPKRGMHPISEELIMQLNRAFNSQTSINNLYITLRYPWEILDLNHILPSIPKLKSLRLFLITSLVKQQGTNDPYIELLTTIANLKYLRSFSFMYGYPHPQGDNSDFFSRLISEDHNDGALIKLIKSLPQLRNLSIFGDYTDQDLNKLLTIVTTDSKIKTISFMIPSNKPGSDATASSLTQLIAKSPYLISITTIEDFTTAQFEPILNALEKNNKITMFAICGKETNEIPPIASTKIEQICQRNAANKIKNSMRIFSQQSKTNRETPLLQNIELENEQPVAETRSP